MLKRWYDHRDYRDRKSEKKDDYNDKESATPCFVRPYNDFYALCAGKQKLQVQIQRQIQTQSIKYKISVFGKIWIEEKNTVAMNPSALLWDLLIELTFISGRSNFVIIQGTKIMLLIMILIIMLIMILIPTLQQLHHYTEHVITMKHRTSDMNGTSL